MSNDQNVLNFLGLAARARKLQTGSSALQAIRTKSAFFVIIAEDASANTKKKFTDKCTYYHVDYVVWKDSATLSYAIGQANRMVIAVTDKNFARSLKEKLGG